MDGLPCGVQVERIPNDLEFSIRGPVKSVMVL